MTTERFAAYALTALGVLTLGTGVYFMAIRPALLPEDVRFTGVDTSLLPAQFFEWLLIVFRTWGGFIAAFGILMLAVSGYWLTKRGCFLRYGTALAVLLGFGRFLVSNILIHSEYLWFIAVLSALALVTAVLLLVARRPSAGEAYGLRSSKPRD